MYFYRKLKRYLHDSVFCLYIVLNQACSENISKPVDGLNFTLGPKLFNFAFYQFSDSFWATLEGNI